MSRHRLHLNVTERCNLRCLHCYWQAFGEHRDPSLETIDRILGEFKRLGAAYHEQGPHMLTLGGGEPTARRDLARIVALGRARGFRIRLVTNASSLDARGASALKHAGLEVAQVSLDGACERTHDLVRGRGSWKRTMAGIAALKRERIFTVLSYVLLPAFNLEEAPLLLDLARSLRVGGVKFARPLEDGQARINGLEVQGAYWQTFRRIVDHANEIRYRRMLLFFDPLAHLLPVSEPRAVKGIWGLATDLCQCNNTELVEINGSTGDVYYCRVRERLGNVWDDDLVQLWQHHPLLQGIRTKTPEGACDGCKVWQSCRGGCPAVVHSMTSDTLLQDQACVKVAEQPTLRRFSTRGHSNRRALSTVERLRRSRRRVRDGVLVRVLR
jgi:radical SAM protein with 4Fe4S-binding SPASM domain